MKQYGWKLKLSDKFCCYVAVWIANKNVKQFETEGKFIVHMTCIRRLKIKTAKRLASLLHRVPTRKIFEKVYGSNVQQVAHKTYVTVRIRNLRSRIGLGDFFY